MKNITVKKALALFMALALALAFCACGSAKEEPKETEAPKTEIPKEAAPAAAGSTKTEEAAKPADAPNSDAPKAAVNSPVGVYMITKSSADGKEEDLSSLAELGIAFYLVVDEDGTAYMDMLGEKTPLKWNEKEFYDEEGVGIGYTYADGIITLKSDDALMVCEKLTGDALQNYLENGSGSLEDLFGQIDWDDDDTEIDIPEGEPSDGPVSGTIGEYYVTILGAEAVEDVYGDPAIRFWYEFTNNSESLASAFMELYYTIAQDGAELDYTYTFDDVPEEEYSSLMVAPGHTIRCAELYGYDPDGGVIAFRLADYWEEEAVIYYADPANLSGAPEEEFFMAVDESIPEFMNDAEVTDGNVELTDVEEVEDSEGDTALRIYLVFTNNTEETTSFFAEYNLYIMQDGYELPEVYPAESIPEDDYYLEDVEPGESITCTRVVHLRSDSPISVILQDFWGDGDYYGDVLYKG